MKRKSGCTSPPQIIYEITNLDGNTPGQKSSVTIEFYRGGEIGPLKAEPDGFSWSVFIPPWSYSGKIEVHELLLIVKGGCLDWKKYFLEHLPAPPPAGPGGGPDFGGAIEGLAPIVLEEKLRFSAAGTWKFYTSADPPETSPTPQKMEAPPCALRLEKVHVHARYNKIEISSDDQLRWCSLDFARAISIAGFLMIFGITHAHFSPIK